MKQDAKTKKNQQVSRGVDVLTICFASLIDFGEVLVAAALVGSLCVVADVGTHSKLTTLVLICKTAQMSHPRQALATIYT